MSWRVISVFHVSLGDKRMGHRNTQSEAITYEHDNGEEEEDEATITLNIHPQTHSPNRGVGVGAGGVGVVHKESLVQQVQHFVGIDRKPCGM